MTIKDIVFPVWSLATTNYQLIKKTPFSQNITVKSSPLNSYVLV